RARGGAARGPRRRIHAVAARTRRCVSPRRAARAVARGGGERRAFALGPCPGARLLRARARSSTLGRRGCDRPRASGRHPRRGAPRAARGDRLAAAEHRKLAQRQVKALSGRDIAGIVARNAVPVAGMVFLGWNAATLVILYYL